MKNSTDIKTYIFTALPCEAKPLISHFRLKKDLESTVFPVYRNVDTCLTVTGLGKAAMAAGVAYTLSRLQGSFAPVLVNVGIAGHRDYEPGEIFFAEKISDIDTGRNYYPQLVYRTPCRSEALCTVSKPQLEYTGDPLYDMEASAFYETAVRFTSSELIQCVKIVSDNSLSPVENINPAQVSCWIESSLSILTPLLEEMNSLALQVNFPEPELFQDYLNRWHFTVSEKNKLKNALSRWEVLKPGKQPEINLNNLRKGKDVIRWLEQEMDQAMINYRL